MSLGDDNGLRAQLLQQSLESLVRGDPELLERVRERFPEYQGQADALGLEVLLPDLATIPAAQKFADEEPVANPPVAPPAWSCREGVWGAAYEPLARVVERTKAQLLADLEDASPEAVSRAEAASRGLVAVGRLYKHVEPRFQFAELTVPGHEALIGFGVKQLLRAAARAKSSTIAECACKLLIGCSFDRLCRYGITEDFDVRKGRGLAKGWVQPPDDADLYGVGYALLSGPGSSGAIAGLRVLLILTSAERWLVAQVTLGLLGKAVIGARDSSHTGPPAPSPLREGLLRGLQEPDAGELHGILAAMAVIGMNNRCEHPGALLRSGLGPALAKAWREKELRPITSALSAYALADLCEEAAQAHSAPWRGALTEEEIVEKQPPSHVQSPEAWRASLRKQRDESLPMKEEYEAGVEILRKELLEAGLGLPPRRDDPASPKAPEAGELPWPLSLDEAMNAAWDAMPVVEETRAKMRRCQHWQSYNTLCKPLEKLFKKELEGNEPGLYVTFC